MGADERGQLRKLLRGELDAEEETILETKLERTPRLRKVLANLALETDRTRPDPTIRVRASADDTRRQLLEHVQVGPTLGRGGMAEVRLGHQLKLDRAVAVKTLREERKTTRDVQRLLHEARITGRLEHPNIVPVHDIVIDEDRRPQVVLKLIEGHTWAQLMRDAEQVQELFKEADLLEWNLSVLSAVCNALSFAHSRGILHRDVKPSNVMVGQFGEVYLLDWGIAIDLDEKDPAVPEEDVSGTPAYMAPEQLEADPALLGTWTDTYLLGATLYHVLVGRPPHGKHSLQSRVAQELTAQAIPPIPEDVPLELKRLLERSLEPDPTARMIRPSQFKQAMDAFLEHRAANRLAERADREREDASKARAEADSAALQRSALAAEVGYRAALDEWPDCPQAKDGLDALAVLRIESALEAGEPQVAQRLVAASERVPDALRERVAVAVREADEEAEQLRQLVTDADRGFGHRARGVTGAGFGLLWVGFWSYVAFEPPADAWPYVSFLLVLLALGLVAVALRAKQMFQSKINRTSVMVVITGITMATVWCAGASMLGLDIQVVHIGMLMVSAMFATGMGTLMDRWGFVSAVGFAITFLLASHEPRWTPYMVVIGNVVLLVNQLILNAMHARRGFRKLPSVGPRRGTERRGAQREEEE